MGLLLRIRTEVSKGHIQDLGAQGAGTRNLPATVCRAQGLNAHHALLCRLHR